MILRRFCLRNHSGGRGKYSGGDGIQRHLQFRRPLQLSILTERRVFEPYGELYNLDRFKQTLEGLAGGEPGKRGTNVLHRRRDNVRINLGSKNSCHVEPGVRRIFIITI